MAWPATRADNFMPNGAAWNELVAALQTDGGNRNGAGYTYSNINIVAKTLKVLTDGAGSPAYCEFGRVTTEGRVAIAAATNQYLTGSAAGDLVIQSASQKVHIGSGSNAAITVNADGSVSFGSAVTLPSLTGALNITGASSTSRVVALQTAGSTRWQVRANDTAEAGLNAGSDFRIARYSDAGAALAEALCITRSSGDVGLNQATPKLQLEVRGAIGAPATSGTTQVGTARVGQTTTDGVLDFGFGTFSGVYAGWLQATLASNLATKYPLALNPNGGGVWIGGSAAIHGAAGSDRRLDFWSGSPAVAANLRWVVYATSTAESGSNVGSDFAINRYSDVGTYLSTILIFKRSSGRINMLPLTTYANEAAALAAGLVSGDIYWTSTGEMRIKL